jgi:hypothetical protein
MLILKQNAANSVPTPPSGKGTIFLDDSDTLSVKVSDGNVQTFPTVGASNAQVVFMDGTTLTGENAFTYDFNTNILTVTGNVAAGNVLTNNLYYANGLPWDLQEAAGSNNQIQYNIGNNFAASANFTYNDSTQLFTVAGNAQFNNANAGNLLTANFVSGTLTTASQPNITSVGTLSSLTVTGNVSSGNISVSGNALISGNLTVNGNVTYINVETLSIEDPVISLGTGPNGAAPTSNTGKDVGSALNYFDTEAKIAFLGWDVSSKEFVAASTVTIDNDVITVTSLGNLRANLFLGDGSQLINLPTPVLSNISNGTSNLRILSNSNIIASVNGVANVVTITDSNVVSNANIIAGNTISANYFLGDGGLLSNLNVAGGSSITNGNSNVVVSANGNVTTSVSGNSNVLVVTGNAIVTTGIKTDNYMYANGEPFAGGGGGNAQPQIFNVYQGGALFLYTGSTRWYAAYNMNINSVKSRLATPADGNVTIEVVKNGNISVLTQTIPPGNTTAPAYTSGIALSEDDYITVNVIDVGSNSAPGYDLYVQFQFLKT